MIIDFNELINELKSYMDRKFEAERERNVKIRDYQFPERVFKMPDIEAYLSMSKKVIIKAIQDGKLKAFKVDRDWRTTREELDKYLDILFRENES